MTNVISRPEHLLGQAAELLSAQRYSAAESVLREVIARDADCLPAQFNLAVLMQQLGHCDEAERAFRQCLAIDPEFAPAWNALGRLPACEEDPESALNCYDAALRCDPHFAAAHFNRGMALDALGRPEEALEAYEIAEALVPDHADIPNNRGVVLQALERFAEAEDCYRRALRLSPRNVEAHNNLGTLLQIRGEVTAALDCFKQTLQYAPRHSGAWINAANALDTLDRHHEALAACDRAVAIAPDSDTAQFNRALTLLRNANFISGWAAYRSRWLRKVTRRDFGLPDWNGEPCNGRTLLVSAEQGVGDEIMFASCLPDLVARRVDCLVECDPRLVEMFQRSFPAVRVFARGESPPARKEQDTPADFQVAMGTLPEFFRRSLSAFPRQHSYLSADGDHCATWRSRLEQLGAGLKIGIAWQGGHESDVRRVRSTSPADWQNLLQLPGCHWINLQHGDARDGIRELQALGNPQTIHTFADIQPKRELEQFAALIRSLDLVITVDNSAAHLAGALGVPTWVLLPHPGDWRWLRRRADSLWYSSLRLIRQRTSGDWSTVFAETERRLRNVL